MRVRAMMKMVTRMMIPEEVVSVVCVTLRDDGNDDNEYTDFTTTAAALAA